MADVEPVAPSGGRNRMFLVIALGLVGLLVIGVIAVGGIFLFSTASKPVFTPTLVAKALPTGTNTRVLPTATATSTDTPTPGPTNTNVVPVVPGNTTPTIGATAQVTGTVGTGTPGSGLPPTGLGEDLVLLAAGVVLVLIIFAARRARATGTA